MRSFFIRFFFPNYEAHCLVIMTRLLAHFLPIFLHFLQSHDFCFYISNSAIIYPPILRLRMRFFEEKGWNVAWKSIILHENREWRMWIFTTFYVGHEKALFKYQDHMSKTGSSRGEKLFTYFEAFFAIFGSFSQIKSSPKSS